MTTKTTIHGMRHNLLKRIALAFAAALTLALPAAGQEGLHVADVFRLYGHAKGCKMVEMHDAKLHGYEMKLYKSLTYKNLQPAIAPYLKADRKTARKIREVVENGRIVSGYYMMPTLSKGTNRYILFGNPRGNAGAIIYIEGALSPEDIMKLCYSSM